MAKLGRVRAAIHRVIPNNIGRYVMPYLVFLLTATLLLTAWGTIENHRQTNELRQAQIEGCESSPVRKVLVEGLEDEILSVNDPRIPELFPDVPKEVADHFVREGNHKTRKKIDRLLGIDCKARYSP